MANKPYHGNQHRKLGTPCVLAAEANPQHRCPRCGLTKAEAAQRWGADAAKWIRGHRTAGTHATSPTDYQAEHKHCSDLEGGERRSATSSNSIGWRPTL